MPGWKLFNLYQHVHNNTSNYKAALQCVYYLKCTHWLQQQLVYLPPKKYEQPVPSPVVSLNGVLRKFEVRRLKSYLGVLLHASLQDDNAIKITLLCSKQSQTHFCSVLYSSKKTLFRACHMSLLVC